ncbi:hypothetical protein C8R43DRAFT_1006228 [Mycena crocata]|nr:hypothetical protein C8R43DRAFT_1006228 [Mycena crocata]
MSVGITLTEIATLLHRAGQLCTTGYFDLETVEEQLAVAHQQEIQLAYALELETKMRKHAELQLKQEMSSRADAEDAFRKEIVDVEAREKRLRRGAEEAVRKKIADFEARDKKLRAEEKELASERAAFAADLARTAKIIQTASERHTRKLPTITPKKVESNNGQTLDMPIKRSRSSSLSSLSSSTEPLPKRTKLQESDASTSLSVPATKRTTLVTVPAVKAPQHRLLKSRKPIYDSSDSE